MAGTSSSFDERSTIGDAGDPTSLSTTAILVRSSVYVDQRDQGPRCEHAARSPRRIATIVRGARLSARAKPMLDYLKVFEQSAKLFPGF
jgi:hypothetical protein